MEDNAPRGIAYGLLLAAPLWALIILGGIALAGCGRHDDGAGDLWKTVKYGEAQRYGVE